MAREKRTKMFNESGTFRFCSAFIKKKNRGMSDKMDIFSPSPSINNLIISPPPQEKEEEEEKKWILPPLSLLLVPSPLIALPP